ncbi:MAG: ammonia-forming cytochrome c nitrite reductase subunit c552 [Pseudomonadota bacterium]|nr:MAG: ammonia-forming cytochrome c nitrite reductase subunit c552 [Pseudomonadota bacterium]
MAEEKNAGDTQAGGATGTGEPARRRVLVLSLVGVAAVTALTTGLLINVFQHKQEAKNPFFRVVDITDDTDDPSVWGKNFPLQYDSYLRTADQTRTRYGGSEALPRTPTQADPRSIVAQSKLEEDPRLKTIWSGYAFAVDFREERGHAYMLEDQTFTERQTASRQPGTCLNCHASTYNIYKRLGAGDPFRGFEILNQMPYAEARKEAKHPVACIDCHDSQTMQLRVTRPAFIEGMRVLKASQGIADYDVNRMATRQEMRSFVCGQCHDEYYFKGQEKRLTYPWHKGLEVDSILAYYDEQGFADWTHKETGARMLKAQHPEFEMWNQGIHARSGVSCTDCHMPYERVGAQKITNHHVQSPLLMVNRACQTCHRWSEAELTARVHDIQDRFFEVRNRAMDAIVALINDITAARKAGSSDADLATARDMHRKSQFMFDFVEAENSTGFHAPGESLRVLSQVIDLARQGQLSLRGATVLASPTLPTGDPAPEPPGSAAATPSAVPPASSAPTTAKSPVPQTAHAAGLAPKLPVPAKADGAPPAQETLPAKQGGTPSAASDTTASP